MGIIEDAKELFGEMRNLTPEEQEAYSKSLDRISEDTGIQLFDTEITKTVNGKTVRVYKAGDKNVRN